MFEGVDVGGQGPPQVAPRRRGGHARAGARRGLRGRHGVGHQLQHGVDLDLRAAADLRLPRPPRQGVACGAPATPCRTTWSAPTPRASSLQVGSAVRNWKPGDRVTVHCNHVDDQDPSAHDDSMLAANQRIWGFETNFGGLADLTVVKANQLMPKPAHLTWEEAACNALCNSTSLPDARAAATRRRCKQGDAVLIWGATGGLGGYAVPVRPQRRRHPGRRGVVARQGRRCCTSWACEHVIDRKAAGYQFWKDEHTQDEKEWRRLGKDIRGLVGEDPDIVFEHPGRQTFGASVFVAARGGTIVTCAATSRLHDRVRQPPPLDEAEEHRQLALRQLQGGVGGQPARSPRARSSRSSRRCYPLDRGRRRRPRRSTTTSTRARSACCASPPRRASASTTPSSARRSARTRSPSSAAPPDP